MCNGACGQRGQSGGKRRGSGRDLQATAGPGAHRVVWHRQHAASGNGTSGGLQRCLADACPVQGRGARDHRRHGRARRGILWRHPWSDRNHPERQVEAARHCRPRAASAAARRAHAGRTGNPRRRIEQLVRVVRFG